MEAQPFTSSTQAPQQAPKQALSGGMRVHTEWNTPWDGSPPNLERHELFAQYARDIAKQERPLLVTFLDRLGAEVATRPGCFSYRFSDSTCWIDCPEIGALLVLLPWAEAHETPH
jgi:hypothetical protein